MIIAAVNHQAANASSAHFGEGDLLRSGGVGHGAIIAPTAPGVKPLKLGPSPSGARKTRFLIYVADDVSFPRVHHSYAFAHLAGDPV
jgi:hypothetical protein